MLEPWDELLTLRRERISCAQDIQGIQESCIREHGKAHTVECSECWTRVLNRMRDRFLLSADKEWFSGRRSFLQELDSLFAQARKQEVDIKTIEQRIADEKREWYRDKVRNLGLQTATKSPAEARALQQKLNDRAIPIERLASDLRECLGEGVEIHEGEFSTFLEQLKAAQSPSAKADAYIDILYRPGRDPAATAKSQKYIDMIADGKPVAEVINIMNRDRQSTKGTLEQKQKLQKKLEELRRAKAAHELAKAKSHQMRQEKARAASASQPQFISPPCTVCKRDVDRAGYKGCKICVVLADQFKILEGPTVFCSRRCYEEGFDSHQATHHCSSGSDCSGLHDADTEMDGDGPGIVFCRECVLDLKKASVFCGPRCFNTNFQRHREHAHDGHISPGIADYDARDDRKYCARNISEQSIALHDVLEEWAQERGANLQ